MTSSVAEYLKRGADRNGFHRDRFEEKRIPTDHSNLVIMPFWGDIRSMSVLSGLLLQRYRQEVKGSKYFIFASWPGFQGCFPYVDEYWSITDESHLKKFYEQSDGFRNKSELSTIYLRNLNEFFRDVVDYRDISKYYNLGLTNEYFDRFKEVKRFLPFIPSAAILGKEFGRELATRSGYKVFIHPSIFVKQWYMGRSQNVRAKKEFWTELINKLLENNYVPVIWQNSLAYDVSQEFLDRCIFTGEKDVIQILAAMRATGCVLDVFNSLSRIAIMARCPFVCVDERIRYSSQKEHEMDDLCGLGIPKEYIYTFSTIVTNGIAQNWGQDIFQSILFKLGNFIPELDRDTWPSTAEIDEVVSYKKLVRPQDLKKFGTRLLKITRD